MATPDRLISLAAGVHPEWESRPADFVHAAGTAGWKACGIWFDPETWTDATTTEVKKALDQHEMIPLDMEIFFLEWDLDIAKRMVDAAQQLGVRHVLSVTREHNPPLSTERFAQFCALGDGTDLRMCVEFMMILGVKSLAEAIEVVTGAGDPRGGILLDNLHLARLATPMSEITDADPHLFPYAQWCDATAQPADDSPTGMIADAMDLRRNVGDGDLPCMEFVDALPANAPLSIEIRSKPLRDNYPDPVDRARHVLEATRAALHNTP